jgi:hypothetical protein
MDGRYASLAARASSTIQLNTNELHAHLIAEVDKLSLYYTSILSEYLDHTSALIQQAFKADFPRRDSFMQTINEIIQQPVLQYSLEAITEAIKSQIHVSEALQMILSIPVADYSLLLTICESRPELAYLQPLRPDKFELFEENKAEIAKTTEKKKALKDWLCRNCMRINRYSNKSCEMCGFQPKDIQADA